MKVSFSLPSKTSKSTSKLSQTFDDEDQQKNDSSKQFITEFDPSKPLTDPKKHHLVIPPKQNEWEPAKRMENLHDLPVIQSDAFRELKFDTQSLSVDSAADGNISYGLNLRQSAKTDKAGKIHESDGGDGDGDERGPNRSVESILLDKLRDDLKRLPEDRGFEEFVDMPVEEFGAALLAGYGWYEGRGIGKNAKGDIKVKQFKKWTSKEGLGYVAPSHDKEKNKEKEGDGFFVGKDVTVVAGKVMGSKGRIVNRLGDDFLVLRLSESGEEVRVCVDDIADLGSKEGEKCLWKLKELKMADYHSSVSSKLRESERKAVNEAGKMGMEIEE